MENGDIVVKRYGTGNEHGELAEIIAIADHPTFVLKDEAGHVYSWAQQLTRVAGTEETIQYWRERARRAGRNGNAHVITQEEFESLFEVTVELNLSQLEIFASLSPEQRRFEFYQIAERRTTRPPAPPA